jgi:hypothetical protein
VQVEPLPQTGHGTPARLVISLALAHRLLQPGCEQATDGSTFLGGENASFAKEIRFNFQGDIGFHVCTYSRVAQVYVLHRGTQAISLTRSGIISENHPPRLDGWLKSGPFPSPTTALS